MKKKYIKIQMKKYKCTLRQITLVIIFIIVIGLLFTGFSIGKQKGVTYVKVNSEIAKPILIVENDDKLQVNATNVVDTYNFKVKNYTQDDEINEIQMQYNIEILENTNEVISFKLYKNEEEIELKENKTNNIKLNATTKQEDNYKLKILYSETNDESLEEILGEIQIKIHSEQTKI